MRRKAPDFEIALVLEEFGFEDVPRVTAGHRKVRCFFHGERNASASVSRFGFRCHACGVSGDAISLLREKEGLSYQDAIRRASEITGGAGGEVSQPDRGQWGGDLLS